MDLIVTILNFQGHAVTHNYSGTALYHKIGIDNIQVNELGYVPIKLYRNGWRVGFGHRL